MLGCLHVCFGVVLGAGMVRRPVTDGNKAQEALNIHPTPYTLHPTPYTTLPCTTQTLHCTIPTLHPRSLPLTSNPNLESKRKRTTRQALQQTNKHAHRHAHAHTHKHTSNTYAMSQPQNRDRESDFAHPPTNLISM